MAGLEMERLPLADGAPASAPPSSHPSFAWAAPPNGAGDAAGRSAQAEAQERRRTRVWLMALSVACAAAGLLAGAALGVASGARQAADTAEQAAAAAGLLAEVDAAGTSWQGVRRIAFGSCTSYDIRPQPIWTQGVIPAQPDAWVWLGDMAYMDNPLVDCDQVPSYPACNCTADYMRHPPGQCAAGDPEHARMRMSLQLHNFEYQAFLADSCAAYAAGHGAFPPAGTDPRACRRPIFGIYDDHDFGWNNGDGRNPAKHAIKTVYLDALGESQASPRRSGLSGLQWHYPLNAGTDEEVDLVLLDGRWFRETMPCSMRRAWCQGVLAASMNAGDVAWCRDFLITGGPGGGGSCCRKDDEWQAWCASEASQGHPKRPVVCDPTSAEFAASHLLLAPDNATAIADTAALWEGRQAAMWRRLVEGATSPLCEVLGREQRLWLRRVLQSSAAPLAVVASGSVVAGGVGWTDGTPPRSCSGDDWLCWPRAQVNLLHSLADSAHGCVVLLVGDYHYSDLKAIMPGGDTPYAAALGTAALSKPIYQVMASGMTSSTAHYVDAPCEGTFREDLVGLRPLGPCSMVLEPAFGMLEVDWSARVAVLSIRNATTGDIATDRMGVRQLLRVSIDTCLLVD